MDAKLSCLIKGLIGVIFGGLALVVPDLIMAAFLAIFWVLVGAGLVICIFLAITSQKDESLFWFIFGAGFLVIGIGSLIFANLAVVLFLVALAALAFYSGFAGVSIALSRPKTKYLLIGSAFVISIVLIALLVFYIPSMIGHLFLTILGAFSLVFGLFSIIMGWHIKEGREEHLVPEILPRKIRILSKPKDKEE